MKTLCSLAAWLCLVLGTGPSLLQAEDLEIQSFDNRGQLIFCGLSNVCQYATHYRIEWASSSDGPWTNCAAFATRDVISPPINPTGSVTVLVPMFYRVVAMVTNMLPEGMVLIPAGTNSGTDPDFGAYSITNPASLFMDQYEVTKAKWDEVYSWAITNNYTFDNVGSGKATNHPVHTVSWYDVVKWCNARSEMEGRPVSYRVGGGVYRSGTNDMVTCATNINGYRLSTRVEWEYAARGGVSSHRFPWSDSDEIQHARANYNSFSAYSYDTSPTRGYHPTYTNGVMPYTSPVGSFAPNGYGLYDMAGSEWEWCWDWEPGDEGVHRIIRGGCWSNPANHCRVAIRGNTYPSDARNFLGFRVALPPGQ